MAGIRGGSQAGSREIFRTSLPLMASYLLEQMIGLTDTAFLGRVGEVELGAAAISGMLFVTITMLGIGYSQGAQTYMGHHNGQGDRAGIGLAFQNALFFLVALSLPIALAAAFFGQAYFDWACNSPAVAAAAGDYLFWRAWSLPVAFAAMVLRAFFIATLETTAITVGSCATVAANCLLNWMLIFGAGPIPPLGIAGAAIASAIAEVVGFAYFAAHAWRTSGARYRLFARPRLYRKLQGTLWRLGFWVMVDNTTSIASWLLFFVAVERLGEEALAISNIERQLCSLLFLSIVAFGSACGAICANLLGEGRAQEVPGVLRRGMAQCAGTLAVMAAPAALFPLETVAIFTDVASLVEASLATHYVMLGTFLVAAPTMFLLFAMTGMGCVREAAAATWLGAVVYVVYTQVAVRLTDNLAVVWSSDPAYYVACGILILWFYRRGNWRRLAL